MRDVRNGILTKLIRLFQMTLFVVSSAVRIAKNLSEPFSKLDKGAKRIGLVVNEDKTKCLLSSNKQSRHSCIGTHVTVDSYDFKVVRDFVYLGTRIYTYNNVSLEIQRRTIHSLANMCNLD